MGLEPTTTSTCCDVGIVLCQLSYEAIDRNKADFPKQLFQMREVNKRRRGKRKKNRLACFSSLGCVITALFDLPWEIMISFNYYT